jgi:phage shock protein PspC (stress-responsive transcriptional regulator)
MVSDGRVTHRCHMSTTPPETQPPPTPGPDSGPRVGWDEIRDLAGIRRTTGERRRVAGVAGGLARHLDIDPLILRVAFVVLTFFGGAGLLLYIACWLLVPEEGSDWARVALDRRSRTVALVLVGALVLVILVGHTWWGSGYPWGVLIVAGVIALIATAFPRRGRPAPAAPGATDAGGSAAEARSGVALGPDGRTATDAVPPRYVEQPRPVNPRKKGPILFWFALAVMTVAVGVLGVVDLAGASVAPSAYPALVLALSGVFLVIGAFWGRAGGIVLVGLLAAAGTAGATIGDRWDPHSTTVTPAVAAELQSSYSMDAGELVLDLSGVSDPRSLDGREISVTGDVGHLDIRVPDDVTVVANTHVTGIGGISAFGRDGGGVDTELTSIHSGGPGAPRLTIDADLHVGQIDVHADRNS